MQRWQLIGSEQVLATSWLKVYRNAYRLPSGVEINDYYVVERDNFVLVVACDRDEVVLVRQYRPATERSYLSLPAGYIQGSERPETTAARELEEETGLRASRCTIIGELHPLPGYIKSYAHVALCTGLTGRLIVKDTTEIDTALQAPWQQVLNMIRSGEIQEMQAVSALLLARQVLDSSNEGAESGG